jgi:hypothetical protein
MSEGQEEDTLHEDQEEGDTPGSPTSDADRMINEVSRDHLHQNPGTHLNGGIADNALWQERWQQLVSFPSQAYDVPSGAIGKWFVKKVSDELKEIVSCKWNSE